MKQHTSLAVRSSLVSGQELVQPSKAKLVQEPLDVGTWKTIMEWSDVLRLKEASPV